MKLQFKNLTEITDQKTFDEVSKYMEELLAFATSSGKLADPNAENQYTKELSRIGVMLADYESLHTDFKVLKVKNPLLVTIEKEMRKQELTQRKTAELLEIKENTFSQILSGKRNITMKLAKKLHTIFNIDADLILENA
jgi:antitoxin component HigA of HigAB toxin-antitoxin module